MVDGQQSGSPSRGFESPGRGFELTDRGFESLGRGLLDTPGAYIRREWICPVCDTVRSRQDGANFKRFYRGLDCRAEHVGAGKAYEVGRRLK